MQRIVIISVKIAVSLGLIGLILTRIDLSELLSSLGDVRTGLLALAFSLHSIGLLLSAARWHILLGIQRIDFSFRDTLLIYWIGSFFNAFLPTSMGGDVVKGYIASKRDGRMIEVYSTIILERGAGVLVLIAIAGLGFIWLHGISFGTSLLTLALLVTGILLLGGMWIRKGRWGLSESKIGEGGANGWIWRAWRSILRYGQYKRKLCWILLLSLLLQINVVLYYFLIASALEIELSFFYFCLYIPPILILTMLPVSIGGIGVRETAFLLFFGSLGLTLTKVISLSLWSYFLALLANLGGGVIYSFYRTPTSPVNTSKSVSNSVF